VLLAESSAGALSTAPVVDDAAGCAAFTLADAALADCAAITLLGAAATSAALAI